MKYRKLGHGLEVSAIGIGCMPMIRGGNILYGETADLDESTRTILRAIDLGVTFFDTAQIYGPFSNEELLGQAIKGKRDGLVIATKFGFRFEGKQITGVDGSPANARAACEGSLQRLGIDTIDLFYQHRVDPNVPIEEVVGGMMELVKEGKVRHIALSEAGPETLRRATPTEPCSGSRGWAAPSVPASSTPKARAYSSSTTDCSDALAAASPMAEDVTPVLSPSATGVVPPARLVVPMGWKARAMSMIPRP